MTTKLGSAATRPLRAGAVHPPPAAGMGRHSSPARRWQPAGPVSPAAERRRCRGGASRPTSLQELLQWPRALGQVQPVDGDGSSRDEDEEEEESEDEEVLRRLSSMDRMPSAAARLRYPQLGDKPAQLLPAGAAWGRGASRSTRRHALHYRWSSHTATPIRDRFVRGCSGAFERPRAASFLATPSASQRASRRHAPEPPGAAACPHRWPAIEGQAAAVSGLASTGAHRRPAVASRGASLTRAEWSGSSDHEGPIGGSRRHLRRDDVRAVGLLRMPGKIAAEGWHLGEHPRHAVREHHPTLRSLAADVAPAKRPRLDLCAKGSSCGAAMPAAVAKVRRFPIQGGSGALPWEQAAQERQRGGHFADGLHAGAVSYAGGVGGQTRLRQTVQKEAPPCWHNNARARSPVGGNAHGWNRMDDFPRQQHWDNWEPVRGELPRKRAPRFGSPERWDSLLVPLEAFRENPFRQGREEMAPTSARGAVAADVAACSAALGACLPPAPRTPQALEDLPAT